MLQVKTSLKPSNIHGIGLFADQFIEKGKIIWEYTPNIDREFTDEEYISLSDLERAYVKFYSFKFDGIYCLCCDDAKFFNHSKTPNCEEIINDVKFGHTIAANDIHIGEELTTDYMTFGINEDDMIFNLDI